MANDLNQCNFIGRLGGDPEIRYMTDSTAVANMTIACGWKSKDKEGAEWVRLVVYNKLAEICGEYLRKGSKIFVSGRMRTRKWQDQQGVERYTTEIIVSELQMLDGKQPDAPAQQPNQQQNRPQQQPRKAPPPAGYQGTGFNPQGNFPAQGGFNPAGGPHPPFPDEDEIPF